MSSCGSKKKGKEADVNSCKYLHGKYSLPNPYHVQSFKLRFDKLSLFLKGSNNSNTSCCKKCFARLENRCNWVMTNRSTG